MNAIIVDDEPQAITNLEKELNQYRDISVVGTARNGAEAFNIMTRQHFDLLFLDIELPDMTGITLLEYMAEKNISNCYVVAYTAYDEYMLPAFRNRAFDYLLKPIDQNELKGIIQRIQTDMINGRHGVFCQEKVPKIENKLMIYTSATDFKIVYLHDICAFIYNHEKRSWETIVAGAEEFISMKRSISKEAILSLSERFIQVNSNTIINLNYLMEVIGQECLFYPPFDKVYNIKISRSFRRNLIDKYMTL